jgi:hypothetical protein
MAKKVIIKQGDTRPSLRHVPQIDGGRLSDPGLQVFFTMMRNATPVVDMAPCRIDGTSIVYDWKVTDTATVTTMQGEFKMVWPDGSIESEPLAGYIDIVVEKSLSLYRPGGMSPGLAGGSVTVEGGDVVIVEPSVTGSPTPQVTRVVTRNGAVILVMGDRIADAAPGSYLATWTATNGIGNPATVSHSVTVAEPQIPASLLGGSLSLDGDDVVIVEPNAAGQPPPTVTRAVTRDGSPITVAGQRISDAAAGTYTASWRAENGVGQPATLTRSVIVEAAATAPDAFLLTMWDVAPGAAPNTVAITISSLPDDNGSPITAVKMRAGSEYPPVDVPVQVGTHQVSIPGPAGSRSVVIYATNSIGSSAWSSARTVNVPAPTNPTPALEATPAGFRLNAYDDPGYELTPTAAGFKLESVNG